MKTKIANNIYVELQPDDEYILIIYKLYDKAIEIIDFKRKTKGGEKVE